jgi:hypothetical protein
MIVNRDDDTRLKEGIATLLGGEGSERASGMRFRGNRRSKARTIA